MNRIRFSCGVARESKSLVFCCGCCFRVFASQKYVLLVCDSSTEYILIKAYVRRLSSFNFLRNTEVLFVDICIEMSEKDFWWQTHWIPAFFCNWLNCGNVIYSSKILTHCYQKNLDQMMPVMQVISYSFQIVCHSN